MPQTLLRLGLFYFMTQFFLVFSKSEDKYFIKCVGSAYKSFVIYRDGRTDEEFWLHAKKEFDDYIERNQILKDGQIVKMASIF